MVDQMVEKPQYTSMSGCFMRVLWAMLGPAFALVSSLLIIVNKSPYGSFPDFMLLGGAVVSIAGRFLDPGITDPNRNDGDIGKLSPRTYATWMLIGSLIVLVVAHSVTPLLH